MELRELAEAIASEAGMPVTQRDVERLLSAMLSSDDLWRILDLSDVPVMAACRLFRELHRLDLAAWGDGRVWLTPQGRALCETLGLAPALELRCPCCRGTGVEWGPLGAVAEPFAAIATHRPQALQAYDQGFVDEASTLARAAFMWAKGDLEKRDVLVLGDDDLLSVALALTKAPRRVVALDIDPRIVEFLRKAAREHGLALEASVHDLRHPLPQELSGAFHTFVSDPSESLHGFMAFARRGMSALAGPGTAGYLGLTRREASLTKWHRIQQKLLDAGATVTDLRDDFHAYNNWTYFESMLAWAELPTHRVPKPTEYWYRSALIRVELLVQPNRSQEVLKGELFNDAEAATT